MSYYDDLANIQKKRALSQALIQQGAQPQGMQAGRIFVGPSTASSLASLASIVAGGIQNRKLEKQENSLKEQRRAQLSDALRGLMPQSSAPTASDASVPGIPSAGQPDDQAIQILQGLPLEQQEALVGQQALARLFPSAKEGFTLKDGEKRFDASGKVIAEVAPTPKDPVAAIQEYQQAQKDGFKGSFLDYQLALKKAGATNVSTQVNTEKGLYGGMADKQAQANVDLYSQAQKAPELLNRAQRVKQLVGPNSQAITGAGAEWLLAGAKVANQLGFNTGDAAADTEALSRDLAASTLDQIKSSGLGAGSGFSNADRDFLEKVVGGKITLEAKTLQRLAELNEKSALATIQKWNATASRLDPRQLQTLGMAPIEMPTNTPAVAPRPKLSKNPDGSYNYQP